ncbi:MAG: type VI secretion system tube protein Hcp [Dehalococcoidia bacterium]|nr:type VI secretion system tube protein Hcp [Dehalococcoidia bacterium]
MSVQFLWSLSFDSPRISQNLAKYAAPGDSTALAFKATVDEFQLGLQVDKSSIKLLDALLTGSVLPKVQVEITETRSDAGRATFLKYEFKDVLITKYDISGVAASGDRPMVTIALNFQEVKVTYTEYDAAGKKKGDTIVQWGARLD